MAGSHHTLHMLLLSLGIGASSFLFTPGTRRAMLVVSLAMTGVFAWWAFRRPHRSFAHTAGVVAAIAASLALVVVSVVRDGL